MDLLKQKFDVVVSGNDPAGYYCSWAAAKEGLNVLHLDSRAAGSLCTEWVPMASTEAVFALLKGLEPPHLLVQKTSAVEFHRGTEEAKQTKILGQVYNRPALDQALAQQAKIAGVHFVQSALFKGLIPGGLEIDLAGETHRVQTRCLVSADGVRSAIRNALGLEQEDFLAALQYRVRLTDESKTVHFFGDHQAENGLGWFVPRGEFANVGFGVLRRVAHVLMFKLHQLLDHLMAQNWIEADELNYKSGGLIPVSGPTLPAGRDGILLVGDAAGLRDALVPGVSVGMGAACSAGVLAGQFIADELRNKRIPRVDAYAQVLKPLIDGRLQLQSQTTLKKLTAILPLQKS